MLYVGYFSYEFMDQEYGKSEGSFTYVVEADDIDDACETMAAEISEKHLDRLHDTEALFLDDVIEISKVPAGGAMLRMGHRPVGDEVPQFYCVLPGESPGLQIFRQGPNPEEDLEAANAYEPEPFLVFEPVDTKPKKRQR